LTLDSPRAKEFLLRRRGCSGYWDLIEFDDPTDHGGVE